MACELDFMSDYLKEYRQKRYAITVAKNKKTLRNGQSLSAAMRFWGDEFFP